VESGTKGISESEFSSLLPHLSLFRPLLLLIKSTWIFGSEKIGDICSGGVHYANNEGSKLFVGNTPESKPPTNNPIPIKYIIPMNHRYSYTKEFFPTKLTSGNPM
jgi:hypothetical protein